MNVFDLRQRLTTDYSSYVSSFIDIRDARIKALVQAEMARGSLWPEPLIQLNPSFEPGMWVDELVTEGALHRECRSIFRSGKQHQEPSGKPLRLHRHQEEAVRTAKGGGNYVLTTGTGSGKSLAYIIPIVDHVLRRGAGRGVQAIVVYPMNALANSQAGELQKFLCHGYPEGRPPVRFARYTGQENDEQRRSICANPPDIILTNYVMLELILTRNDRVESTLLNSAKDLRFLVLDELHTYRGRQGADVAMLVRRTRDRLAADALQCVGTSATMASGGTSEDQRVAVAQVASSLFGAKVAPQNVISETLRRATPNQDLDETRFRAALQKRVADKDIKPPTKYEDFVVDPLSIWIESTFGVRPEASTGRLVRARPRGINDSDVSGGSEGAAKDLASLIGVSESRCAEAIQDALLGGYQCSPNPETGFRPFAFRLHQFISRGDTVYATMEPAERRHLTLQAQQFKPGDRSKALFPLVFCREGGQEYYCVRRLVDPKTKQVRYVPREMSDTSSNDELGEENGYLCNSESPAWPHDPDDVIGRLPADWIEERRKVPVVKRSRVAKLPRHCRITLSGIEGGEGKECVFIPAPFGFCLTSGVSYAARQKSDLGKLTTLGSGGRSTATTILSLSILRHLRSDPDVLQKARKLLSFTDNRQDASLQAGHFNDFIETAVLRSAVYRAAANAGTGGMAHDILPQRVFDVLGLPIETYAADPTVKFQARVETEKALRNILGYRIYRDLQRGWRVTAPNLEQCGLLEIRYESLDELCEAQLEWSQLHPALASAPPKDRAKIAKVLLDHMRRELAIKVDYLDPLVQERMVQQSSQRLIPPWALDDNERPESAGTLYPSSDPGDEGSRANVYLSSRGGFGQYLRRPGTLALPGGRLTLIDTDQIIRNLLDALRVAGIVEMVSPPREEQSVPGYQLVAAAMRWVAADGSRAFHDPIRIPQEPEGGARTNPFFVEFYKSIASELKAGFLAREHTAQVEAAEREEREKAFRDGRLPLLYCSPTMELGVDISELNVVNMRNVPPTPANYAQRSGRAGRSGQPALVVSYCTTGSPHDQYFFKRPDRMVAGAVTPPRLDLGNEDLIRAHIHAVWLAETGVSLGMSLKDVLDVSGTPPALRLQLGIQDDIGRATPRERAKNRSMRILSSLGSELSQSGWYTLDWLDRVLNSVVLRFDEACERWRGLYRAALAQYEAQTRIIKDATRNAEDKTRARLLLREADTQMQLLLSSESVVQSDFYSYRYFASEGFLPGYSFPRLPVSAYIPGRKTKDEFLSRPRFLAISEFGPRAIIYHEGSRYAIQRAILPLRETGDGNELPTQSVKLCPNCGYAHVVLSGSGGPDLCENCHSQLNLPLRGLFRMQNVSTRRRDKINCDEEERMRMGFELRTALRFARGNEVQRTQVAEVVCGDKVVGHLTYGHSATLFRINFGWSRRANPQQLGFVIDLETGMWARNDEEVADSDEPTGPRPVRVVPYVDDTRNCLLFEPSNTLSPQVMASLQAALKTAIQVEFQLEDNELAAEPLPKADERRLLLFYEAAEGGAGVLRRIVDDPEALPRVAKQALDICHFNSTTGDDKKRAPHSREDCEAACYDCLMSYGNQREHKLLDRKLIRDLLMSLSTASVRSSPTSQSREQHLEQLLRLAGSELEKRWVNWLNSQHFRLPSRAQVLMESCQTRPDFVYDDVQTIVYVDGPPHLHPERQTRDDAQSASLDDAGFTVVRFRNDDNWESIARRYPNVFGTGQI